MTSLEAYKSFLLKVNKNDSNRNVNVSKGQFVLIYNEQRSIWLNNKIEVCLSSDNINEIEELLETDTPLAKIDDTALSSDFQIPTDFFDYSSSYSVASKKDCSDTILFNWDIKNKNINSLFIDDNQNPSFEYQETFVRISKNLLKVHRTPDFTIKEAYLDYYRLPAKIDISGYTNVDGTQSADINPDLSDKLANEIISYAVEEVFRNYSNIQDIPIAKDRIQTEIK